MSKVQDALKAREERKKKEQEETMSRLQAKNDKVNSALDAYKSRKKSSAQSASSDLVKRINSEIEIAKSVSNPSWGKDSARNTLDSTRESRVRVTDLTREVESYKNYFDEDTYNSLISTLKQLNDAYDSHLKVSEVRSQFASEDEYNKWYEKYKKGEEFKSVLSEEDFEGYSRLGADSANPTWDQASAPIDILGWKPLGDGDEIRNMVTFAEANATEGTKASGQAMRGGGSASPYSELINLINQYMEDEEKRIYNYYIGKGDKQSADEYLAYITDILRQRQGGKIAEQGNNNLSELMMSGISGAQGGFQGIENFVRGVAGTEGTEISALQYASAEMRKDNTGVWMAANDLATSVGNMTPALLAGGFTTAIAGPGAGKAVGSIVTGISSAGNSYAEMIRDGYGVDQARKYGIMVGAAEGGLSYLFSGISSLGGKVTGNVISKVVDGIDSGIARFFANFAINTVGFILFGFI